MKKIISLCLVFCMILSVAALSVVADENAFVGRTPDLSDNVVFFDNVRENANNDGASTIAYTNGQTDGRIYAMLGTERYAATETGYGMKLYGKDFDNYCGTWSISIRDWVTDIPDSMYLSIHYQVKNATNSGSLAAVGPLKNGNNNPAFINPVMDIENDTWKTYTVKIGDCLVDKDGNATASGNGMWPANGNDFFQLCFPALEGEGAHYIIDYLGFFASAEDAADEAKFWEAFHNDQPMPYSVSASVASGTYFTAQTVELSTATQAAKIFYTLDGSEPTKDSTPYTAAVEISENATLKTVAYDETKQIYSNVVAYDYVIESNVVITPVIDPALDFVPAGKEVSISTETEGAEIYYTIDGSEPTAQSTKYTAPITVNSVMTIKAIAIKEGMENSAVSTVEIKGLIADSIVWTFSGLVGGSANGELSEAQGVYHNNEFAAIFGGGEWGLKNDAQGGVVMEVHKDKEIALRIENWSYYNNGSLPNGSYRYLALTYKAPVELDFNYHALHYQNGERSAMLALPAAEAYTTVVIDLYELNPNWAKQGGQPDFTLQFYHEDDTPTTLSILNVGFYQTEAEAQKEIVAAPNASVPASEKYLDTISVELITATEGATIYYTDDGSEPSVADGKVYTGAISISSDTVIKAIAVKEGCYDSPVVVFDYKVTPTVAQPNVNLKTGQYEGAQTIVITCATEGAKIYYTTNGKDPSATEGTLYTGPITLDQSCIFKAIAILEGKKDSSPVSRTYNIIITEENTTAPEAVTKAPEEATTAAPTDEESGCASSMTVGTILMITVLSGAGVVICKKKEN